MKRIEVGTARITSVGTVHRITLMVALTLVLGVLTPCSAYASDGFLGGLQDLVGTREVEVQDYEGDYLEEYGNGLRADPPDPGTNTLTDLGEDATTVEYVNDTIEHFNNVSWGSQSFSLLNSVRILLGTRNTPQFLRMWVLPAAGLVFLWWGVRKSIQIVMSAFRKGSMNV